MSDEYKISFDDDGAPDDVFFWDLAWVHIERMDIGHIWMQIARRDGSEFRCEFYTPRNGRLNWMMEEDS